MNATVQSTMNVGGFPLLIFRASIADCFFLLRWPSGSSNCELRDRMCLFTRLSAFLLLPAEMFQFSQSKSTFIVHFYLYPNWQSLIISPKIGSSPLFIDTNLNTLGTYTLLDLLYWVEIPPTVFLNLLPQAGTLTLILQITCDYWIQLVWNHQNTHGNEVFFPGLRNLNGPPSHFLPISQLEICWFII